MNSKTLTITLLLAVRATTLGQTTAPAAAASAQPNPMVAEVAIVTQAHASAHKDDDSATDTALASATSLPDPIAPSVLLARRATMLCGWLQADNDYGRAEKVATRVINRLADLRETSDTDHEERLYWEACLEAQFLDHKARAITLLRAAERLKPDDTRVTDLELPLVAAMNTFGH